MDLLPDVSVIITMYNSESFVEHAIQSVLQQEPHGLNIEIIVVDDGSTDGSCQVVESIRNPSLHLIRMPVNRGQAHARNEGLKEAKGAWIQFLDSDDRICLDLYQKFEKKLQPGINCYVFSFIRESPSHTLRQTITSIKDKRAFGHFGGSACNKFINKNICLPFKPFRYSDLCFTVDMMNEATLHMDIIPDAYYLYNKKNEHSITAHFDKPEFLRMFNYLLGQINKSDRWTRMFILEMGIAFLFDRNIPLAVSVPKAFLSILRLYRYLPAVIAHQNRHFIKNESI
ncbi:MAG TPA: glycosyltransferase family 2 protein [Saprospiraceae bacterium]|nr:glycosyltransferase family 2 protein [Saprospiraceae bacterium]